MRVVYYLFISVTTISFKAYIAGKVKKKEGRSIKLRCFKDIDNDDFRDDLTNAPWQHILNYHDIKAKICTISSHRPLHTNYIFFKLHHFKLEIFKSI